MRASEKWLAIGNATFHSPQKLRAKMIRHGNKGELMSSLKGDTYDWHSSAFSSLRLQNGPYIHQDHCTNSGAQQSHEHFACIGRGGVSKR